MTDVVDNNDDDSLSSDDSEYTNFSAESHSRGDDDSSFDYDDETDLEWFQNPEYPSPRPPLQWDKMSVKDLDRLLAEKRAAGTLGNFLTSINTESMYYVPTYEAYDMLAMPDDDNSNHPKLRVYIKSKTYDTMLGFACMDANGIRGEEKIKRILKVAKEAGLDCRDFLTVCQTALERQSRRDEFEILDTTVVTPLHSLLSNEHATSESLRLLCNAWPPLLHCRNLIQVDLRYSPQCRVYCKEHFYKGYLFHLLKACSEDRSVGRLRERTNILFEAAETTREGARGLVMARDALYNDPTETRQWWKENDDETSVLVHYITAAYTYPEAPLALLLPWWPECLKFCPGSFSTIFQNIQRFDSVVKLLELFMRYSTLQDVAGALIYANCFSVLVQALEDDPFRVNGYRFHVTLESRTNLANLVQSLLRKRDVNGRSLLHYILARSETKLEGRCDKDVLNQAQFAAEWILKKEKSLALATDKHGLNPIQYAISKGKRWQDGRLEGLAAIMPEWLMTQPGGLLAAFASAPKGGDGDSGSWVGRVIGARNWCRPRLGRCHWVQHRRL